METKNYINSYLRLSTLALVLVALPAHAQTADDEVDPEEQTVLDDSPFISPRADGMAGAISALADGTDANYYNPAGIGGIHEQKTNKSLIRKFYFIYAGLSINQNSYDTNKEMQQSGAASDATIGSAIIDTQKGERQFTRVSLTPNFGIGRLNFGPIYDMQLAAVPVGDDTDLVDMHYQEKVGLGMGLSVADPKGRLYLGAYATYLNIRDVNGRFLYTEMVDKQARQDAIKDDTSRYSGLGTNVGLLWKIADPGKPSLAVVARNLNDTRYSKVKGDGDELVAKEDLNVGFAVSPRLGKVGFFNFSIEGGHLSDESVEVNKKWRTGIELNFGDNGSESIFGLRAGGSQAGAAFGAQINLWLLGIQYANFPVDVGIENKRMIERRQSAVLSVNLAE
jgi:hypothetical protein